MMNVNRKVMEEQAAFEKARDRWWENLSTAAKKSIVRKGEVKLSAAHARRMEEIKSAQDNALPYVCPKCFMRFESAAQRNEHREVHRDQ